jgi:hypothetical protein
VFAINARNKQLQAIRSYSVRSGPNPPFTILQAARATMAFPDLFSSVCVGSTPNEKEFVAHFTNPIESVLDEAGKAFEDTTKVACILSLGSGTKQTQGLPVNPQPADGIKLLMDIAEDCETTHQGAASRYRKLGIYHRINVERDFLYAGLNEWEDGFTHISRATRNYLQVNTKSLDRVVERFIHPVGGKTIQDLSEFYRCHLFLKVYAITDHVPNDETMFPPPPALSDNFIGRSDLIEAIVAYHVSPPPPGIGGHRKTVLHGIGGIGKTQLSIRIAQELRSRYVYRNRERSLRSYRTGIRTYSSSSSTRARS